MVKTPKVMEDRTSVWAHYSIQVANRDALRRHLSQAGIPTAVHYPKPLHLQECFSYLGYRSGDFPVAEGVSSKVMSLPMNAFVAWREQEYIAHTIDGLVG